MTTETTTEQISEVQKSDAVQVEKSTSTEPSVVSILAEIVKKQDEKLDNLTKAVTEVTAIVKEHNANPVDSGVEAENKPKTEDENDVGDKVTAGNEVAPSPKDQASIIAPAVESSGSDKEGLKMENKADDEDEKKVEVEKTDEDEKDEDMKKSERVYEIVKTVRPKIYQGEVRKSVPTGYQILKAAANGFGETTDATTALTLMYEKFANGEFGNGLPTGGVY